MFAERVYVDGDVRVGEDCFSEGDVLLVPVVAVEFRELDEFVACVACEAGEKSAGDNAVFALVVYFVGVLCCVYMVENVLGGYGVGVFVGCHLHSSGAQK